MNYIVLDMEWNQPFGIKGMNKSPVLLRGEIVQIGAVKLDETYRVVDTFKIMIEPKYYRRMHKKVSQLTGITTEDLQYGFPFSVAFKHFQRWCGEEFIFFTWGMDDITVLRENMMLHEMNTEWIPNVYNIQLIFDAQITKESRQISLVDAIEKLGKPARQAHDALNDARNTAVVCRCLDMVKGLGEYEELQKQVEQYKKTAVQQNRLARLYETRDAAFADAEVVRFRCPVCGAEVVCDGLVKQKTDKYICIAKCEKGDEIFIRFKFKKIADCKFGVNRILYNLNEEIRAYYLMKKQAIEDKKKQFAEMQYEDSADCMADNLSGKACLI